MSTIPNNNDTSWHRLRKRLHERMEARRVIQTVFSYEQAYFFIECCRTIYQEAGTKEAKDAIAVITNEGTFLLVADSRREWLDMFPGGTHGDRNGSEGTHSTVSKAVTQQNHAQPTLKARGNSGRPFRRFQEPEPTED